jgi:hypothetical protein
MTLTCHCAGWGFKLLRRVCLRARVCGVMVAGSAALVGMCVRCALGPRKCDESWLRHTRGVECASLACIAGAVSSAVTVARLLCRSIAIGDLCCRFCIAAARLPVAVV